MARYPGATWRPVAGHTDGPMRSHTGVVLHVNESNGNLFNWVAGDNGMSCHFEVYKDGSIEQYLDTAVSSWCQMDGNADYLSIETEGYTTEPLTRAQLHTIAQLLIWLKQVHGIPLQLSESPGQPGFGWHGMGGAAWGGHSGCPGTFRRAQRANIINMALPVANSITPPPAPNGDEPMTLLKFALGPAVFVAPADLAHKVHLAGPADLVAYEKAVTAAGNKVVPVKFSAGQIAAIPTAH